MSDSSSTQRFKIGAVERASGVPAVTIRMWERRYQALTPERTESGGRLYTREQIERLSKLRSLVSAGHAISTVAGLSDAELEERLNAIGSSPSSKDQPLRVGLVGEGLQRAWAEIASSQPHWQQAFALPSLNAALADAQAQADVLILEMDALPPGEALLVQNLAQHVGARHVAFSCHFATRADLQQLKRWKVEAVKAPLRGPELELLIRSIAVQAPVEPVDLHAHPEALALKPPPPNRYTPAELRELATRSTVVQCECPEHLVEIVSKLNAFEAYSRDCQSANRADAALHMLLYGATAQVRRIMEDMLASVVEADMPPNGGDQA